MSVDNLIDIGLDSLAGADLDVARHDVAHDVAL